MNNTPNIDDYPRLTPPNVVYENKDALKKKAAIIPLYAKIASAAAVVALMVGLFWHLSYDRPEQVMTADLVPVKTLMERSDDSLQTTGKRAHFVVSKPMTPVSPSVNVRPEISLVATLEPCRTPLLKAQTPILDLRHDSFEPLMAQVEQQPSFWDDDLSMVQRGIWMITDGQHDSFGSLLLSGWRSMKEELLQINESVADGIYALKQTDLHNDWR